jgi:hypothetical protein
MTIAHAHQRGQRRIWGSASGNFDDVVETIGCADFEMAGALHGAQRQEVELMRCQKQIMGVQHTSDLRASATFKLVFSCRAEPGSDSGEHSMRGRHSAARER